MASTDNKCNIVITETVYRKTNVACSLDENMKELFVPNVELINWDNTSSSVDVEKKPAADPIDWDKIEIFEDVKNKPPSTKNVVPRPIWVRPPVKEPRLAGVEANVLLAPPILPVFVSTPVPPAQVHFPRPINPNSCRYGAYYARQQLVSITLLYFRHRMLSRRVPV